MSGRAIKDPAARRGVALPLLRRLAWGLPLLAVCLAWGTAYQHAERERQNFIAVGKQVDGTVTGCPVSGMRVAYWAFETRYEETFAADCSDSQVGTYQPVWVHRERPDVAHVDAVGDFMVVPYRLHLPIVLGLGAAVCLWIAVGIRSGAHLTRIVRVLRRHDWRTVPVDDYSAYARAIRLDEESEVVLDPDATLSLQPVVEVCGPTGLSGTGQRSVLRAAGSRDLYLCRGPMLRVISRPENRDVLGARPRGDTLTAAVQGLPSEVAQPSIPVALSNAPLLIAFRGESAVRYAVVSLWLPDGRAAGWAEVTRTGLYVRDSSGDTLVSALTGWVYASDGTYVGKPETVALAAEQTPAATVVGTGPERTVVDRTGTQIGAYHYRRSRSEGITVTISLDAADEPLRSLLLVRGLIEFGELLRYREPPPPPSGP